jgi:hypothetical protein
MISARHPRYPGRRGGAGSRRPPRAAHGRPRASPPRRACPCGGRARRRGSRGTWPPWRPRGRRAERPRAPRRAPPRPAAAALTSHTTTASSTITSSGASTSTAPGRARRGQFCATPRGVAGRDAAAGRVGRGPQRDQAAGEDDERPEPDPRDERRGDEPELGREAAGAVQREQAPDGLACSASGRPCTRASSASTTLLRRVGIGLDRGPYVARKACLHADLARRLPSKSARTSVPTAPGRGSSRAPCAACDVASLARDVEDRAERDLLDAPAGLHDGGRRAHVAHVVAADPRVWPGRGGRRVRAGTPSDAATPTKSTAIPTWTM